MRLTDLEPELIGTVADGKLYFDCPQPGCSHRVMVLISDKPYHERELTSEERSHSTLYTAEQLKRRVKVWQATGQFPDTLSLTPSIDLIEADEKGNKIRTLCWHGFITNGSVT